MISFYRHFIFLLAATLTPLVVEAEAITVDGAYARASSKLAKSAAAFGERHKSSGTGSAAYKEFVRKNAVNIKEYYGGDGE